MAKKEAKKEWRKAVQQAMEKSAKDEALRRFGTSEPGFNYRWEHVQAVVKLAVRLAGLTGADKDVVEAAAWLHDVAKEKGANHPEEGAKVARKLLPKTDFPAEKIDPVAQAIAQHMGLWRDQPLTNLEAMVLWDADKLAKIGLRAAFHWTGMYLIDGKMRTTKDLIHRGRMTDWQARTVASMHTEDARGDHPRRRGRRGSGRHALPGGRPRRDAPRDWGDPDAACSRKQFFEILQACCDHLPPVQARVFMMREWLDLEAEEICRELAITSANLWVLLHRARLRLRECLHLRWFDTAAAH